MEHKSLAVEYLKKLLNQKIQSRTRSNIARRDAFSERLMTAITRYHNRGLYALQVLQELIEVVKDLATKPGYDLDDQEPAFYDALAQNESAMDVMASEYLRIIAAELITTFRSTAGKDWWRRDDIRGRMRVQIRRILRRYGYPPDLQVEAICRVIRQAEALSQVLGRSS